MAVDYGMFGEKKELETALSRFLQELRESPKAEGEKRIFIHGEKEFERRREVIADGIPVNDKTYDEMKMIAGYTKAEEYLPVPIF